MTTITGVRVRTANEPDLRAIHTIYNDAIRTTTATWDEEPWTMARREAWFAEHDASTPVLVAECEGLIAGFAYLTRMSAKSGWRFTREDTIYIDPAYHRRGIGRALLSALLDRARELGLRLIVATISADNSASIALHERMGFELVGTLHHSGYKFGQWLDTSYYQLDLQAQQGETPTGAA